MTADLRALAEAATPGPWEAELMMGGDDTFALSGIVAGMREDGTYDPSTLTVVGSALGGSDGAFIAAANPAAILDLLDRLDRAERIAEAAMAYVAAVDAEQGSPAWGRIMTGLRATVLRCRRGVDRGSWIWECDLFASCGGGVDPYLSAAEANDAARAHLRDVHGVGADADGIGWPHV